MGGGKRRKGGHLSLPHNPMADEWQGQISHGDRSLAELYGIAQPGKVQGLLSQELQLMGGGSVPSPTIGGRSKGERGFSLALNNN